MAPHSRMSHEERRKLAELRQRTFFFLEGHIETGQKDEKLFGIFTLSLECLHYFRHFRRR